MTRMMHYRLYQIAALAVLSSIFLSAFAASDAAHARRGGCKKLTQRKEWMSLTKPERAEWVSSVKCLANIRHQRLSFTSQGDEPPQGAFSIYDSFSSAHSEMYLSAHDNPYFLPWHRWFLHLFDSTLRETCGYDGPTPFWDWSLDSRSLSTSPVFDPSPRRGLGGTGDCSNPIADCRVTTGAFAGPDFQLSFPIPHPLRRNISVVDYWDYDEIPLPTGTNVNANAKSHGNHHSNTPDGDGDDGRLLRADSRASSSSPPGRHMHNMTISPAQVGDVIFSGQYDGDFWRFQHRLMQMHNHIHNFIGGDLAGVCPGVISEEDCALKNLAGYTPNDPIFWLHHAQLDRLWSAWQQVSPDNFYSFAGVPRDFDWNDPSARKNKKMDPDAALDHLLLFDRIGAGVEVEQTLDHEEWPLCYTYVVDE